MFPPRTLLALAVIAVLVCLAVATVVVLVRARRAARGWKVLGLVMVLGLAGVIAWVMLVLPAYWD